MQEILELIKRLEEKEVEINFALKSFQMVAEMLMDMNHLVIN